MADVESVVSVKEDKKVHVIEDNQVTLKDKSASVTEVNIAHPSKVAYSESSLEDSEYETLEEDEDGSLGSRRRRLEDGELSDSDSVIIEDERVDGDGEEESEAPKDRKLDDDEDRRNPQYIPKKGTFYEHDDRTLLDAEEEEDSKEIGPSGDDSTVGKSEVEQEVKQKKVSGTVGTKAGGKVWIDKSAEKWQHDLYNEDEQRPKSTQELIDTYGYDIRNEEAPPKARRRRRYGRGPNKYTRNWEDEAAYRSATLSTAARGRGRGRGGTRGRGRGGRVYRGTNVSATPVSNQEEFPVLGERRPRRSISKPRSSGSGTSVVAAPSVTVKKIPKHFITRPKSNDRNQNYISKRISDGGVINSVPVSSPADVSHKDSSILISRVDNKGGFIRDSRGRGRTRGGGGAGAGDTGGTNKYPMEFTMSRGRGRTLPPAFTSQGKPSSIMPISSSDTTVNARLNSTLSTVVQKFNNLDISSCSFTPTSSEDNSRTIVKDVSIGANERRIPDVPPRMQETSSTNVGRSKRYSAQRQRSLPETTYSPPPPATPPQQQPHNQLQHQQQPPIQYFQPQAQPIPVPDFPPPPVFNEAVPPPQMVAFIPPGPPPPPGAAPPFPPPPIINYVPTPAPYHPIPLQPPPAVQQAELFQGQNGITYYSTQTQAALPRQTPPRRVKLAIPIMPPPEQPPRGRGRSTEQDTKA
ncbi:CASC3 exon junction complex subunit isoform X2 [Lycorma delicatula]|uniref:CASC3 exon junction complex subunit isoform X2 n=1 Tax=Lycorma delicatula TaxID=130591 RepID=UPI003F516F8D